MREKNRQNTQTSSASFLEKFSGKLNVITKHGQIKQENALKLPIINSPQSQSKRYNTMQFRSSKQSLKSFFSEGRSQTSKSSICKSRAEKYLTHNFDRPLVEISNHFQKHPSSHTLKKAGIKYSLAEPLSAVARFKKERIQGGQHSRLHKTRNHNTQNYDYESFLNQLHSVSHVIKLKKGQSHQQSSSSNKFHN